MDAETALRVVEEQLPGAENVEVTDLEGDIARVTFDHEGTTCAGEVDSAGFQWRKPA